MYNLKNILLSLVALSISNLCFAASSELWPPYTPFVSTPEDVQLRLRADSALAAGKKDDAMALYLKSAQFGDPVAAYTLATLYQENNDLEEAINFFHMAITAATPKPSKYASVVSLPPSIEFDHIPPLARVQLGKIYESLGNSAQAKKYYKTDSDSFESRDALIRIYTQEGKPDKAKKIQTEQPLFFF